MKQRHDCQALDAADALRPLREHFTLPAGVIYLDGNSLGAQPRAVPARVAAVVAQQWGRDLITSWNKAGWFALPRRVGDRIAPWIGAQAGQVVAADTTSINLYKALSAALSIARQQDDTRRVVVSERSNFPTDLYIAEALCRERGCTLKLIEPHEVLQSLQPDVAVLMLTQVNYRTGALHDMAQVTAAAHAAGVLTVWDLCHSAGAVPVDLTGADADFAVGCTYKYLNGGPGSPAMLWAKPRHRADFWQPLSGWWGHQQPFAMQPAYQAASGIRRFLCGTQAISALAMVECGLDIALQADMQAVRNKSLALGDLFITLVAQQCSRHPLTLITPRDHAARGSHVSFCHPHGYAVMQALIARGVIGDYREPAVLRFGLTPLYLSHTDIWDAVAILQDILDSESWRQPQYQQRAAVT